MMLMPRMRRTNFDYFDAFSDAQQRFLHRA